VFYVIILSPILEQVIELYWL